MAAYVPPSLPHYFIVWDQSLRGQSFVAFRLLRTTSHGIKRKLFLPPPLWAGYFYQTIFVWARQFWFYYLARDYAQFCYLALNKSFSTPLQSFLLHSAYRYAVQTISCVHWKKIAGRGILRARLLSIYALAYSRWGKLIFEILRYLSLSLILSTGLGKVLLPFQPVAFDVTILYSTWERASSSWLRSRRCWSWILWVFFLHCYTDIQRYIGITVLSLLFSS